MNAPWYSPDQIDWEDGLNPLAIPAYREQRNPFVYRALQAETMVQLRALLDHEPRIYAEPAPEFASLAGLATYDAVISAPAGTWIVGISASSQQAEGFLAEVKLPTGEGLFNKPTTSASLKNAKPLWLSEPAGLPDGGGLSVRLINLSAAANLCQFCLWVIEPA